jgi:hypothetical protein
LLEVLTSDANVAFTAALMVMVLITLLEGLAVLFGLGLSSMLDSLLPDIHIDTEHGEVSPNHGLAKVLGWMHVGEVPALIVLIVALTTFGLLGISLQTTLLQTFGFMLPASIAWLPALLAALPISRVFTGILTRILPGDETEAVSRDSFVGKTAFVTTGVASADNAAQARVTDEFGQNHYLMVLPQHGTHKFVQGSEVLIIKRSGSNYIVGVPPAENLP